jgi:hypothetical protein
MGGAKISIGVTVLGGGIVEVPEWLAGRARAREAR